VSAVGASRVPCALHRWPVIACGLAVAALLLACGRGEDTARAPGYVPDLPTLAETAGLDPHADRADPPDDTDVVRIDRIDPCSLVTREEAEAIVRASLLEPRANNVGSDRPSCTYGADPAGTTAQVQVFVGEGADSLIATHRRLGGDLIEVEELGEGAFLRHSTLHFHPSGIPVVLSVVRLVDAKTLHPAMIGAARTIAQRMTSPSPPTVPAEAGDGGQTAQ
jgi:hypothetical protein